MPLIWWSIGEVGNSDKYSQGSLIRIWEDWPLIRISKLFNLGKTKNQKIQGKNRGKSQKEVKKIEEFEYNHKNLENAKKTKKNVRPQLS